MNRIFAKIKSWWYLYLIALVALPLGTCYLTYLVNLPRNEETITLFIASCQSSTKGLYEELMKNRPDYLREINIRSYVYYEDTFSTYYSYFGRGDADIVILPESKIASASVTSYYKKWSEDMIDSSSAYYSVESGLDVYGKLIHKKGEDNSYISYKDDEHDENYYLFYGKNSLHLGPLSNSKWNTALLFAKILEGKE